MFKAVGPICMVVGLLLIGSAFQLKTVSEKTTEIRCNVYPENFVSWMLENGDVFHRYSAPIVGIHNFREEDNTINAYRYPERLWMKLYIGDIDWRTLENAYLTFENICYDYRRNTILGRPDVNLYTFDIYAVDTFPVGAPDDKTWNFYTNSKKVGEISTKWKPEYITGYSLLTYSGVKQLIDNRYIVYDTPNVERQLLNFGGDNLVAGLRPVYYVRLGTGYTGPITVTLIDNWLDTNRIPFTFNIENGIPNDILSIYGNSYGDTYSNGSSFCYFWWRKMSEDENRTLIYIEFVTKPERPVQVSIKCPDNNILFYFEKGYSSYSTVIWCNYSRTNLRASTTINITDAVREAREKNKTYLYLAIKARGDEGLWQTLNPLYPYWTSLTYVVPFYYNYIYPVYYSGTSVKFGINWVTGVKLKLTIVDQQTGYPLDNVPKTIVVKQDNTTIQTITTSDAYVEIDNLVPESSYYIDVYAENYVTLTNQYISTAENDIPKTLYMAPSGAIIVQPGPSPEEQPAKTERPYFYPMLFSGIALVGIGMLITSRSFIVEE